MLATDASVSQEIYFIIRRVNVATDRYNQPIIIANILLARHNVIHTAYPDDSEMFSMESILERLVRLSVILS